MSGQWNNPQTQEIHLSNGQVVQAEVNGKSFDGKSGSIFNDGEPIDVVLVDGEWREAGYTPTLDPFERMTHDDFMEALKPENWKEVYQRLHTPTLEALLEDGRLTLHFPSGMTMPAVMVKLKRSDVEALTRFLVKSAGVEPLPATSDPFPEGWTPMRVDESKEPSMSETPFNQEKALKNYTELMRLVDVGAYSEREPDGSYAEDGIEYSIDALIEQAAQHDLKFIGSKGHYTLEPMSEQEKAEYQAARLSGVLDVARDRVTEDMPYVIVGEVRPYQYHFNSQRWYVEVDVKYHEEDQGEATVLCRVWLAKETGFLKATRVSVA